MDEPLVIGAVGAAVGGVITAFGAALVNWYKARGAVERDSDEQAIDAYKDLVKGLSTRVAALEKDVRDVLKSEAECRAQNAAMAVEIRVLQSEIALLKAKGS